LENHHNHSHHLKNTRTPQSPKKVFICGRIYSAES